jgi:hypothetical protein
VSFFDVDVPNSFVQCYFKLSVNPAPSQVLGALVTHAQIYVVHRGFESRCGRCFESDKGGTGVIFATTEGGRFGGQI